MVTPATLQEALSMLNEKEYTLLAGGTDLMVKKREWGGLPANLGESVMCLFHLHELDYVKKDQHGIHIGAMTRLETLLHHELINEPLKCAIREMASPAIRHVGTIGGNIGNASPAGDTLPVLYVFNAKIVLTSTRGSHVVSIQDFIEGPGKIVRRSDEIMTEIILEDLNYSGFYYEKVGGRRSDAISKVSFVGLYIEEPKTIYPNLKNRFKDIRCAFGAVYKTVLRDKNLEEQILYTLNEGKGDYISMCDEVLKPIDDQRSTAKYRRQCSINLLKSFVQGMGGI